MISIRTDKINKGNLVSVAATKLPCILSIYFTAGAFEAIESIIVSNSPGFTQRSDN